MQMLGIWVIESPFVRNCTKAMGGMYSFSRIGGKTRPFCWGKGVDGVLGMASRVDRRRRRG